MPIFALTIGVSAFLLFLVQPMVARMLLPLVGGTPLLWSTLLAVFQTLLLAGYAYSYTATRWRNVRAQVGVHCLLVAGGLHFLPLSLDDATLASDQNVGVWLVVLLAKSVAYPFLVLSTTSPLVQHWFYKIRHERSADPYFLYIASNVGSFIALLAYPMLIETTLSLSAQRSIWNAGYAVLLCLMAATGVICVRRQADSAQTVSTETASVTLRQRLTWLLLAMIPASLMSSVTTYISTDLGSIPLWWVVPLMLYLLSFIVAFSEKNYLTAQTAAIALTFPGMAILAGYPQSKYGLPIALFNVLFFFLAALYCHTHLAARRPPPSRLGEFYLWMSAGGAIGGIFNAFIAPVMFTSVTEYPLSLTLLAIVALYFFDDTMRARNNVVFALLLGAVFGVLARYLGLDFSVGRQGTDSLLRERLLNAAFLLVPLALWIWRNPHSPRRAGLGFATTYLVVNTLTIGHSADVIFADRSYYGTHLVVDLPLKKLHVLMHGSTIHGVQSLDPAESRKPALYYYEGGPGGQAMRALNSASDAPIAIVGLGAGSMACYVHSQQSVDYYELDRTVVDIASNPHYFTYLRDCAPQARIIIGDARQSLGRAADNRYQLIVLDAYGSDSIPMHLLTREAFALYRSKLRPDGRLLFHISNRFYNLAPVVDRLMQDAHWEARLGIKAIAGDDALVHAPSTWVAAAPNAANLGVLATSTQWSQIHATTSTPLWTDDFSSALSVLNLSAETP